MFAVKIEKFGASSELQLRDVPEPEPGPDELAVRVHAAGTDPNDAWPARSSNQNCPERPDVILRGNRGDGCQPVGYRWRNWLRAGRCAR